MIKTASAFFNSTAVHLISLMAFALLLNKEATYVPGGNEQVYFLYLFKAWHHAFLAHDWTVQGEPTAGHAVFNFVFGWPTLFIPLEIYGWIGRLGCWFFTFVILLRLGRHLRIQPWMVWVSILLWLIQRQAFVSNEWIIGTFEAKCIAYICLLWALELVLGGWLVAPAVLTGLSLSFHTAVGLWGGAAIGLAFAMGNPFSKTLKFAAWAVLFALPGVITTLLMFRGGTAMTPEEAKFLVTIEMPFHLDPIHFGGGKVLVLLLMLAFNCLHAWTNRNDRQLMTLVYFEIFLGAFFLLGFVFRLTHQFTLMELFPFRVFAVLIMLLFFWHLAAVYQHRIEHRPHWVAVAIGIFVVLALPSPVMRLQTLASFNREKWRAGPSDDFRTAAQWISNNTAPDAVVIAPPWRKDAFYFTHRALIADWHAPRYNSMTQWRQRIEALVGDVSQIPVEENLLGEMDQRARDYYQQLTPDNISAIQRKYGGDILLSPGQYSYPILFRNSTFFIYQLAK